MIAWPALIRSRCSEKCCAEKPAARELERLVEDRNAFVVAASVGAEARISAMELAASQNEPPQQPEARAAPPANEAAPPANEAAPPANEAATAEEEAAPVEAEADAATFASVLRIPGYLPWREIFTF